MKTLEASEVKLAKVFSPDYDFVIPDYQRPYAWTTEESLQLLDDLEEALESNPEDPYFLGSVVLIKDKNQARSDVIDGQQRLTTTTILLAVIRDLEEDEEIRSGLAQMVREPGNKLDGLAEKPRLRLRERDAQFFATHIQAVGSTDELSSLSDHALNNDSQRNIRDNALALRQRLARMEPKHRHALAALIRNRVFLVMVQTPDIDSAHRIFAVMNDRGLDLKASDIIKSKVIGALPDELRADYASTWEDAEEKLGREAFGDLFLHIRLIFAKERQRKELLREFQAQVLSQYLPERAQAFADDVLLPYAEAYTHLLNRDLPGLAWSQVNTWLERLSRLDNADWRPPALWMLRHHRDEPELVATFLARLERLASSMFVRRVYSTPRVMRYIELLKQLEQGLGVESPALELGEDEKRDTLWHLDGEIYLTQRTVRQILERLDEELGQSAGVNYEHDIISVEHVLPQRPKESSRWFSDFSEEEREHWTHRLANLVLLNRWKNSEAQNYDFEKKKQRYFTSPSGTSTFALTSQVLATPEWTPEVLEDRQRTLVAKLTDIWNLHPAKAD